MADRSHRGLLEITGTDRVAWLHNLTTNQVNTLARNDGNYAFALNVKGRILFDMNVLAREDALWLDVDRAFLDTACKHLDKYIIMEDVSITDRTEDWVRFGLAGAGAAKVLEGLGAANVSNWPSLGLNAVTWTNETLPAFRHDFCGSFGIELFVPAGEAVNFWQALTGDERTPRVHPVGDDAVQVCRIEHGIPWPGREITDEYLPAETGQMERAVSYNKGCYLGQEVVERMRSRDVVARRLVGLRFSGRESPPIRGDLTDDTGTTVGNLTSACHSVALNAVIGLGYVKTACARRGIKLRIDCESGMQACEVVELPFV